MKTNLELTVVCGLLAAAWCANGAMPGDEAVVVYNRNLPESRSLAEYYAKRRQISSSRVFGFDLPSSETISRNDFTDRLAQPLLKRLRDDKLFVYDSNGGGTAAGTTNLPRQARIRFATLCYGVPLKIVNDPTVTEEGIDKIRTELRRNEASVDSELAALPVLSPKPMITGVIVNRAFCATNAALLSPTNGLLLVGRLDGPTPEIARGLVDKAIQAEVDGLWGRAYFDSRGLTNTTYKIGDDWIRGGADVARRLGFETILDQEGATFSAGFPLSHVALYAGWYDGAVSGPFTRPNVEFMPGAFAYHLHSFSANTIRSATAHWVGPLLAKGATATLGCVNEPYLEGTPDILTFLVRFLYFGFSFGEAAYAAQNSLSWQTTVVGDPLYRPFGRQALQLHNDLIRRGSSLVEWSHLKVVNMNLATGLPPDKLIQYLETTRETRTSAVLLEKLADLYFLKARWVEAVPIYRQALLQKPSPQQNVRLMFSLARTLDFAGKGEEAFGVYQDFVKAFPDYPDLLGIYQRLSPMAESLGKPAEKQRFDQEIQRLTPPPPSAPAG
ncbi:MAG: TIGR03790 family protein [Verrucomicrobiia bacterium]